MLVLEIEADEFEPLEIEPDGIDILPLTPEADPQIARDDGRVAEPSEATGTSARTQPPISPEPPPSATAPLDWERAVDEFDGDQGFFIEVLDAFLQNAVKQVATIHKGFSSQDADMLMREAHTIKGGALNLTAQPLGDAAFELEKIGRSGELGEAETAIANLEAEIGHLKAFFETRQAELL